jgi:LmbE family N-acetylglucosaminyl deacetylase
MGALKARRIEGASTPEAVWKNWFARHPFPTIAVTDLVPPGCRAVFLAPHPDDEILMAGGLLQALHAAGVACHIIAATDGEGSHAGSTEWPQERLLAQRPQESRDAQAALAIGPVAWTRLQLPDGGLMAQPDALFDALVAVSKPGDRVFTTWSLDGHPDHDACGVQATRAAAITGAAVVEIPVWAWHWSQPDDPRVPWSRARCLPLDAAQRARKEAAVQAFQSQLTPDDSTGRPPILPDSALARVRRTHEIFFI